MKTKSTHISYACSWCRKDLLLWDYDWRSQENRRIPEDKIQFQNINSDYTCNADGIIEGNDTPSWFTGHKESSRLAITGGLLQRIASPLYLYAGAGYGSRIMGWEMPDDQMAECKDYSYEGVEAEVGCILRIKNIALSAGVQTNSFKYWEATAGIGIMF